MINNANSGKRQRDNQPSEEIRIEGLHKAFGDHRVLRGIDLTIYRGDIIAIVGGSGCGKTVLLNHILGQVSPDAGRVLVTNHELPEKPLIDLTRLSSDELDQVCQHWGVVFQRNALFSGSVYENMALWLREIKNLDESEIKPIALSALKSVALPQDEDFLTLAISDLSGGMAKRLAVARAIAMTPAVIFYDEPTTGLDPTSSAQIHDLIIATHFASREEGRERTTVIITHDKDLLKRLKPRTVMLHEGKVYYDGSLNEFEKINSPITRPYFELMPVLHQRLIDEKVSN
ncbi:MAG: ATP-binding cassette domain-containing protein [Rhodospirillales bacterium]|nr:ATP-binding cassette domain-containing protein [Rhodospirillales bacterium]